MFIALEGGDGVGKSTLVEVLREQLPDAQFLAHGVPKKDVLDEYALDYESLRPGQGTNVVWDRLHWGQPVYGPIYRAEGDTLGVAGLRWVEMFHQARGTVLFHIDEDNAEVKRRIGVRGDDYIDTQHIDQILDEYRIVRTKSTLYFATFIPSNWPDREKLVSTFINVAQGYEHQALNVAPFKSYIGHPGAKVLLLGEKKGGKPPYPTDACFMPRGSSSGRFLLESLPDPFWKQVGIANATEEDVPALIEALGHPQIVALGRKASDVLLDHDIEHGGVPHPAHAGRFNRRKQKEYGELIQRAAETGEVQFGWPN